MKKKSVSTSVRFNPVTYSMLTTVSLYSGNNINKVISESIQESFQSPSIKETDIKVARGLVTYITSLANPEAKEAFRSTTQHLVGWALERSNEYSSNVLSELIVIKDILELYRSDEDEIDEDDNDAAQDLARIKAFIQKVLSEAVIPSEEVLLSQMEQILDQVKVDNSFVAFLVLQASAGVPYLF